MTQRCVACEGMVPCGAKAPMGRALGGRQSCGSTTASRRTPTSLQLRLQPSSSARICSSAAAEGDRVQGLHRSAHTVTTSSALHITWQTPIARCADTLATCATKRDANCSPRRVFGNTSRAAKAASGIAHSEAHLAQTERELTFYMVVLRCSATQRLALHGACGGGSPRLCIVFTTLNKADLLQKRESKR